MNTISYSLFGNDSKYIKGAIHNCKLASKYFPDWCVYFYVDKTVPNDICEELKKLNSTIIYVPDILEHFKYGYRFLIVDEPNIERFLICDTDDRLSPIFKSVIDDWISTKMSSYVVRTGPAHNIPILGGAWGSTKTKIHFNMLDEIIKFDKAHIGHSEKGFDQDFLGEIIWPIICDDAVTYGEAFHYKTILHKPNFKVNHICGVYDADTELPLT
jgi:hypothetical protein